MVLTDSNPETDSFETKSTDFLNYFLDSKLLRSKDHSRPKYDIFKVFWIFVILANLSTLTLVFTYTYQEETDP